MDVARKNLLAALVLSTEICFAVAEDDNNNDDDDDDDDDDEDDAMLIFGYVAFALGGILIIIAIVLLIRWWSKTRKRKRDRKYLRSNFQIHSSDPWLKNSTNTHRVQTEVEQEDAGDLADLDVHTFEGRTSHGQHTTDSLRTRQARRSVSRNGSSVNTNGQATSGNHVGNIYERTQISGMPLPVTLIDAVSSEESSATHTSTSPIISSKSKTVEPEPDYDNYVSPTHHRHRTSGTSADVPVPRIVAGLEPEATRTSSYSRRAQAESVTTSEVLAALDAATDEGGPNLNSSERPPSDFAVDEIFLNANSLERTTYGARRGPRSPTSTLNSQRPHSGYSGAYGNEALRDDREVIYNVTLTVS